jgi:replicative DNA helicase
MLDSLPHSKEAEEILLSAILFWPVNAPTIFSSVPDEHFYDQSNLILYKTLRAMQSEDVPLESGALQERLKRTRRFEKIGGAVKLFEINNHIPVAQTLPHYKKVLQGAFQQRTLLKVFEDAQKTATSPENVEEWLSGVIQKVLEVAQDKEQKPMRDWKELCNAALDRYQDMAKNGGLPGHSTGISKLDECTGGLQMRKLWVLGGGTGDGKSALAEQIIIHNAERGVKCGIYALEMDEDETTDRAFALKGAPPDVFRRGIGSREEIRKLVEIGASIQNLPIIVKDVSGIKLGALLSDIRAMANKGVKLFMVDYGQLIESDGSEKSREAEVARVSRSLKNLSKRLDICIMLLSQLNDDGKLRESRALGMDADVVLTISTPTKKEKIDGQYVETRDNSRRTLFLGKVRKGMRDVPIPCRFHGSQYRFEEIEIRA